MIKKKTKLPSPKKKKVKKKRNNIIVYGEPDPAILKAFPTKYERVLDKTKKYFDDFHHHGAQFPSIVGLALYLDMPARTLYDWRKEPKKKELSDLMDKILAVQHEMLIGNGIDGTFNPAIAKLVLAKHGYHDKTETTVDVKQNLEDLTEEEIDQRIKLLEMKKGQV